MEPVNLTNRLLRSYASVCVRQTRRQDNSRPSLRLSVSMCTNSGHISADNDENFFRYSSGRWLWDEQEQLQKRYRRFSVASLKEIAASAVGAQRCLSMCKLAEGGFNKIFRLTMDNGSTLIARLPNRITDGVSRTVASEVATMDFASRILGIPVPEVLSWNDSSNNPVQSEYILMAEARGTPLYTIWESMAADTKDDIVKELVSIEGRLSSVSFSRYGSIYFSDIQLPGCEKVQIQGSIASQLKSEAESRYVIGPVVEHAFWDRERKHIPNVHGPWTAPQEYIRAVAQREITWLSEFAKPGELDKRPLEPGQPKDLDAHIELYRKFLKVSDKVLPADEGLVKATLWHWDLRAPNIFVQDGKISDIIDWQDCWAGPLMIQAQTPGILDHHGEPMTELPPHYSDLEEGEEKQEIRSKFDTSRRLLCYYTETKRSNPDLFRAFQLPYREIIRDAICFAANTWDDDPLKFRDCLIRIQRYWDEICPGKECPFEFTQDELDAHVEESKGWNKMADFWDSISELVKSDGFVLSEDFDDALALFAKVRETGLEALEGEERESFEKATRWALGKT